MPDPHLEQSSEQNEVVEENLDAITQLSRSTDREPQSDDDESTTRRKRQRVIDTNKDSSSDSWSTITRPTKRKQPKEKDTIMQENTVDIIVTSNEAFPKQFTLAKLLKNNYITGILQIKYINPLKLKIIFNDENNATKFSSCKTFQDMGWRCTKSIEVAISYGVVKNIEVELSMENFLENVYCNTKIVSAKRLNKRNYERNEENTVKWISSESVLIGFEGPYLPPYIFIYDIRLKIEPYVFPVTQCSRCWRFGHLMRACPSRRIICPKCTGNHANCETTKFKCVNCSKNHMALARNCPAYIKEKRIRELMSEFNCTYQKALTLYISPSSPHNNPLPQPNDKVEFPYINVQAQIHTENIVNRTQTQGLYADSVRKTNTPKTNNQFKYASYNQRRQANYTPKEDNEFLDWESLMSSSQVEFPLNESIKDKEKQKRLKTESSLKVILNKIKGIIFNGNISFKTKIHQVITVISEWFISFVVKYLAEFSFSDFYNGFTN